MTAMIEYFFKEIFEIIASKFERSTLSFKRRRSMILFRFLLTRVKIIKSDGRVKGVWELDACLLLVTTIVFNNLRGVDR